MIYRCENFSHVTLSVLNDVLPSLFLEVPFFLRQSADMISALISLLI
jgi:hypothetical protein